MVSQHMRLRMIIPWLTASAWNLGFFLQASWQCGPGLFLHLSAEHLIWLTASPFDGRLSGWWNSSLSLVYLLVSEPGGSCALLLCAKCQDSVDPVVLGLDPFGFAICGRAQGGQGRRQVRAKGSTPHYGMHPRATCCVQCSGARYCLPVQRSIDGLSLWNYRSSRS
jgi:hypothetical protein